MSEKKYVWIIKNKKNDRDFIKHYFESSSSVSEVNYFTYTVS